MFQVSSYQPFSEICPEEEGRNTPGVQYFGRERVNVALSFDFQHRYPDPPQSSMH